MKYPSEEEALRLLEKHNVSKGVIKHSIEVKESALVIGQQIKDAGHDVDLELLKVGALLHDIGRGVYDWDNGFDNKDDYHEMETCNILKEEEYEEFGEMLQKHALAGLTKEETEILGFPDSRDLMPDSLHIKILCIADKVRHGQGILTLKDKLEDYKNTKRLWERYFDKKEGLFEDTCERVTRIWEELVSLGMRDPPISA
tara:strand:+ start:203 stop:802 length:600 start_codon:yes stop_codon:yes gene_type:complete